MIAGALVMLASLAIFPVFYRVKVTNLGTSFRDLCNKAVQDKLAYYQTGVSFETKPGGDATAGNKTDIQYILNHNDDNSGFYANNGFQFAKAIYNSRDTDTNALTPDCIADRNRLSGAATPRPARFSPVPQFLGTREAFGSHANLSTASPRAFETPSANCSASPLLCGGIASGCPCSADQSYNSKLGSGFQIYVNIQRVQSLTQVKYTTALAPDADCPREGDSLFPFTNFMWVKNYDFLGATDAIKITATAVYNFDAPAARSEIFGIKRTSSLVSDLHCSGSVVLKPSRQTFRYLTGAYLPNGSQMPGIDAGSMFLGTMPYSGGHIFEFASNTPAFSELWNELTRTAVIAPNNRGLYLAKAIDNADPATPINLVHVGDENLPPTVGTNCIGSPNTCTATGDAAAARLPETLNMPIGFANTFLGIGIRFEHNPVCGNSYLCFKPIDLYVAEKNAPGAFTSVIINHYDLRPGLVSATILTSRTLVTAADAPFAYPSEAALPALDGFQPKTWFLNATATQAYFMDRSSRIAARASPLGPGYWDDVHASQFYIFPFEGAYSTPNSVSSTDVSAYPHDDPTFLPPSASP